MNIDDPLNKKSSWGVLNFRLHFLEVFMVNLIVGFFLYHWLEYLLRVLCDGLGISHIELITKRHVLLDCLFVIIDSFSTFFSDLFNSLFLLNYNGWFNNFFDFLFIFLSRRLGWSPSSWRAAALVTWFRWLNSWLIVGVGDKGYSRYVGLSFFKGNILGIACQFLLLTCDISRQINVSLRGESIVRSLNKMTLKNKLKG